MNTHGNNQSKGDQFANRLSRYGGEVILIVNSLPDTRPGKHLQDQLLRSGTSPGAHYEEARGAQSAKDFVYKISVGLKETRESLHWLRVGLHAEMFDRRAAELLEEGSQLVRMLGASQQTARRNLR